MKKQYLQDYCIKLCKKCGRYHLENEECEEVNICRYKYLPNYAFNECIICGMKTDGKAFCDDECNAIYEDERLDMINAYDRAKTQNKNAKISIVLHRYCKL